MQHLVTGLEPARIEGGSGAGLQRTSRADQPAFEIQESDYRKSGIDKSGPIEGAELASARGRAPARRLLPDAETDAETVL